MSFLPPVPTGDVIGHYDCRRLAWERAKALRVENRIFTKEGTKDLKIYFDEYERELERDTFFDVAARTRHPGISFATRRQHAERSFDRCMRELDRRCELWLAERRSYESLAFLPIEWSKIIMLRRNGINSVASFEMVTDSEILKLRIGIGPTSLRLIRGFCKRALELQRKETPVAPSIKTKPRVLEVAPQLPF